MDTKLWILMLWPVYILLSFIKNLDRLAWLSFISNILMITGFICIFFHIFETLHNPAKLPAVAPARDLPLFFASAIFTYESIGLVSKCSGVYKSGSDLGHNLNEKERKRFSCATTGCLERVIELFNLLFS